MLEFIPDSIRNAIIKFYTPNLICKYPPPYTLEVWDYGKTQFNLINKAIQNFDWNKLFSGQDIHNQVNFFKTTILNIFHYFK